MRKGIQQETTDRNSFQGGFQGAAMRTKDESSNEAVSMRPED